MAEGRKLVFSKALVQQFLLYCFVGGTSAVVDFGSYWILINAKSPLLVAASVSFVLATLLNYFLSFKLAFTRGRFSPREEIIRFWVVSLVGLALNTSIIWAMVDELGSGKMVGKLVAFPTVLVWNYVGRLLFVFHPDVPETAQHLFGGRQKAQEVNEAEGPLAP